MKCALLSANRTWLPDQNGKPLAGCFLRFFDMETSNPAEVYADPGNEITGEPTTTSLGTEVQLDASGFAPMGGIWLDITKKYRMEVAKFIHADPVTGERHYQKLWDIGWLPSITENIRFDVANSGTVEALSLRPDTDNAFMCVSGYYRPGDGGGGVFYWDAQSEDAADGGMTFAPDSGGPGRWKRILHGRVLHSAYYGAHAHIDTNNGASALVDGRWNAMMDFKAFSRNIDTCVNECYAVYYPNKKTETDAKVLFDLYNIPYVYCSWNEDLFAFGQIMEKLRISYAPFESIMINNVGEVSVCAKMKPYANLYNYNSKSKYDFIPKQKTCTGFPTICPVWFRNIQAWDGL